MQNLPAVLLVLGTLLAFNVAHVSADQTSEQQLEALAELDAARTENAGLTSQIMQKSEVVHLKSKNEKDTPRHIVDEVASSMLDDAADDLAVDTDVGESTSAKSTWANHPWSHRHHRHRRHRRHFHHRHHGHYAATPIPSRWVQPHQIEVGASFEAKLGAKNGVPAHHYEFAIVKAAKASSTSGRWYSDIMIKDCAKIGMKPVCDHPSYCRTDTRALYIGQTNHLAYPPHRSTASYNPAGFDKIQKKWDGLCSYTGERKARTRKAALCNVPSNTHNWLLPSSARNPKKFMCGKVEGQ